MLCFLSARCHSIPSSFIARVEQGCTREMEALAGMGRVTPLLLGARNLPSAALLISGISSRQFIMSKTRIQVQRRWSRRLENVRNFAKVGEETGSTQDNAATSEDPRKIAKGKGFGAPKPVVEKSSSAPSSNIRRAPPQKPLIGAQVDEETKQFETGFVASLTFLFSLIIIEGIALAASGFLPEEWDEFLVKVIYPIFTPTVGVFLVGAAGYGVWKYFGGGEKGPTSK